MGNDSEGLRMINSVKEILTDRRRRDGERETGK